MAWQQGPQDVQELPPDVCKECTMLELKDDAAMLWLLFVSSVNGEQQYNSTNGAWVVTLNLNLFLTAVRLITEWPFSLKPPLTEPPLQFVAVKIWLLNRWWRWLSGPSARSAAAGLKPTSQRLDTSRQWSKAQRGARDVNMGETQAGSMRQHKLTIRSEGAEHPPALTQRSASEGNRIICQSALTSK